MLEKKSSNSHQNLHNGTNSFRNCKGRDRKVYNREGRQIAEKGDLWSKRNKETFSDVAAEFRVVRNKGYQLAQ